MLKDWSLTDLRSKGMKCESATAGEEKISGSAVNRVGKYSYGNLKKGKTKDQPDRRCYRCNLPFAPGHMKNCKALKAKCTNCKKIGHLATACQQGNANVMSTEVAHKKEKDETDSEDGNETYQLNIVCCLFYT